MQSPPAFISSAFAFRVLGSDGCSHLVVVSAALGSVFPSVLC